VLIHRFLQHAPLNSSTSSSNSRSSTSASATNLTVNDVFGPKFKLDKLPISDCKKSLIWKYFVPFNLAFHLDKKFHRICLICRQMGIDKALAIGNKCSLGNLITHLMSHPKENKEYAKITAKVSLQEASEQPKREKCSRDNKLSITKQCEKSCLNPFTKWTVVEFQPFNIRESSSFKAMIQAANPRISPPGTKLLKRKLNVMKVNVTEKIKTFLVGKYFSVTIEHWTSVANENYAALTLHTIDEFVLKS